MEVPAPVIAPVHPSERPRIIKETIAQPTVDLGWGAINNQREAEQARAKIKSEATPPRDPPPKNFVRATETKLAATATPASTSTPIPRRTFTPRAIATPITTPTSSPTSLPESTEAPRAAASSPPVTSPANRGAVGEPQPTATAISTATPGSPTAVRERGKLKSVARQFEKQATVPMKSPAISPRAIENATPLPTPSAITTPSVTPRPAVTPAPSSPVAAETSPPSQGGGSRALPNPERRGNPAIVQPGVRPGVSASPAETITPAESGNDDQGKRDKGARRKQSGSSPSTSPSPAGGQ